MTSVPQVLKCSKPRLLLHSAQPDNVTSSGVSSAEAAEPHQVLTNPNNFDVQIITDSMATVHACLHALLVRDTLRRNFRKGRFRVKDRLLAQISAYIQSLPDVEGAALSGISICQKIQRFLETYARSTEHRWRNTRPSRGFV